MICDVLIKKVKNEYGRHRRLKGQTRKFGAEICIRLSYRLLGDDRVHLPLCKVADPPFHIQGGDMF